MSLTVEQKINLLILAGFEPGAHKEDRFPEGYSQFPRIWGDKGLLASNNRGHWAFHKDYPNGDKWRNALWSDMRVGEIRDELIYKACES